jgi:flagellar protein FliO/FliZ
MNASASLIQVTIALLFMVGLIVGLAWLMKRFSHPLFQQQKHLRLVASLSLGVKEKIILVEVDGKQLVLGVTPQQITSLHVIDNPLKDSDSSEGSEKNPLAEKSTASDFSKKLMEILKGNRMTS